MLMPSDSHSASNLYIELLAKFRRAYAAYGTSLFFLDVVTQEELDADPRVRDCLLSHVPLGDGSGWWVVGSRLAVPNTPAVRRRLAAARKVYCRLASRAGAALPRSIRRKIPRAPADPLSWWLTFLWHLCPPSDEALATPDGITSHCRAIWIEPFLESIDAIEVCKLHTDHPQFPPDQMEAENEKPSDSGELSDRQRDILQVLYERKAFDKDNRMTTLDIADAVMEKGRGGVDSFKRPIADLKRRGLIDTTRGSGGGCWLTADGQSFIKQARDL